MKIVNLQYLTYCFTLNILTNVALIQNLSMILALHILTSCSLCMVNVLLINHVFHLIAQDLGFGDREGQTIRLLRPFPLENFHLTTPSRRKYIFCLRLRGHIQHLRMIACLRKLACLITWGLSSLQIRLLRKLKLPL